MPTVFLYYIDILGTIAFAVSGAFLAMDKKLDPFGVLVISFVTAIGGGTLRDILIGNLPVGWLQNSTQGWVIFLAALAAMVFGKYLKHLSTTLFMFDALGLGLYTIVGIKLGLEKNFSMGVCISLGTITGCFGGVLRDVLLNNIPLLFRKEIYALACIFGGVAFYGFTAIGMEKELVTILSISIIFITRLLVVKYKLSLPMWYGK